MYPNLRAEMARKNLGVSQMADMVGISQTAFYDKVKGRSAFTLDEAYAVKRVFFDLGVDVSIDYLFEKEEE